MTRPILIVGAGLFGSVLAERIANDMKRPVTVIEKRGHIGGNCWSETDPITGVEVHKYGPHIFHTSNREVWDYISRFTEFNNYQHHVRTRHKGKIYSMPINLETINSFYGLNLTPAEAEKFIASEIAKENISEPANLEEKAISLIGRPLYEAFIKGYTIKQWEKDPRELAPEIITRLPVRYNYNSRYFNDRWEGIPLNGYAAIFEKMLSNPLITVKLDTDWADYKETAPQNSFVVYTGPIDQYFGYKYGKLEWRTLDFETAHYTVPDFLGSASVNEADADKSYTRQTEYRHFHPEINYPGDKTVVVAEISKWAQEKDEPYYPVNTQRNRDMFGDYQQAAKRESNVAFGGRLGNYKYYDMDKCIAAALQFYDEELRRFQ